MPEETIICRCSDITLEEVRRLISQGYRTIDEIKRICRLGMGPCGGKTCIPLIMGELARANNTSIGEVMMPTYRPPAKNVSMSIYAKAGEDIHEE
jgi:NAD(P)H-nitrite reductase large subunit